MLQSPQKLFRSVAVWAVLLVIVLASLSLGARPAWAADTDVSSVKVYEKHPVVVIPAGTITRRTQEFTWNGTGRPVLSSTPDGSGAIFYYDNLKLDINGIKMSKPLAGGGCDGFLQNAPIQSPPWDLKYLLQQGQNRIMFEIWDNCGLVGNSDIYIVIIGGTMTLSTPEVPSVEPPAPEYVPTPYCRHPRFFGVRGSGEKKNNYNGYGETIGMLGSYLMVKRPDLEARPIDYPAIRVNPVSFSYSSDYVYSVEEGVRELTKQVRGFIRSCQHTYVLLAGYSQGAEVVGLTYSRLSEEERRHIASVTLFGDPRFNPDQVAVNQGDIAPGLGGIDIAVYGDLKTSVPAGWESRVQSYCTDGDPICNFHVRYFATCNALAMPVCPHGMYYERGWVEFAAAWAVENLRKMPPL